MTEVEYNSEFEFPKDTIYLVLTGELWGVLCEDFRENLSCYNGTTLYINMAYADVRPSIFARTLVGKIFWLQHFKNGFLLSISPVKDSETMCSLLKLNIIQAIKCPKYITIPLFTERCSCTMMNPHTAAISPSTKG